MNKSVLMIMGGALVVAILVAVVVQTNLSSSAPDKVSATSVEILVANKKLLTGEKIKPEDVRWQAWPDDALFIGMIKRADQADPEKISVTDAPLRRTIEAGEPVTEQATIADVKGNSNFLAATIGAGMRAVSVPVKPETAVSGFLSPGDFVDVILAYRPKFTAGLEAYAAEVVQDYASETVLSNVKVLAVDQEAKNQEHAEATTAKTVTLEVTRAQAEKLALAQGMGELSLSLRRIGEKDTDGDTKAQATTDMGSLKLIRRVGEVKQTEQQSSNTVRVYSGTEIQNVPVRQAPQ